VEEVDDKATNSGDTASLTLFKGNSDPFSSTWVTITAQVHELLTLSSQFVVFWAWSSAMSSLFRSRAQDGWLSSVRSAVHGTTEMHLLLSAGCLARAEKAVSLGEKQNASSLALTHKTQALTQLRQQLIQEEQHSPDSPIFPLIFQFVSMDFYTGNEEAALWHYTAIRQLVSRSNSRDRVRILQDCQSLQAKSQSKPKPVYAIAEVWIAVSNLRKPEACGMVDWDAERQSAADQDTFAVLPQAATLFHYDTRYSMLHSGIHKSLRPLFRELQRVTVYMTKLHTLQQQEIDEVETYQIVNYLDQQGTKLRADILELWLDFEFASQYNKLKLPASSLPSTKDVEDALFSAQTLSALLFINIIFMYKPNHPQRQTFSNTSKSPPITRLMNPQTNTRALRNLQWDLNSINESTKQQVQYGSLPSLLQSSDDDDPFTEMEVLLWVSFICSLTERLQDLDQDNLRQPTAAQETFRSCAFVLGCGYRDVRDKLRQFLYLDGLMDWFLEELFEGR
jgi:hypothetical protein